MTWDLQLTMWSSWPKRRSFGGDRKLTGECDWWMAAAMLAAAHSKFKGGCNISAKG